MNDALSVVSIGQQRRVLAEQGRQDHPSCT